MTPTTGSGGERCAACDRAECRVYEFDLEQVRALRGNDQKAADVAAKKWRAAVDDCEIHAIDWRARALTAEADLRATAAPVGVSAEELDGLWMAVEYAGFLSDANAKALTRLLDAHAALVSHGDGIAAQLVEVTRERDALRTRLGE
jgi:hypothetical protein